jgi:sugar lactone lactonase YvrE
MPQVRTKSHSPVTLHSGARYLLTTVCLVLTACGGGAATPPSPAIVPGGVAPSVTLQPADATVSVPVTATFTAAASGVAAPMVQWQQSTDAGLTWTNINGATGPSFTTPATAMADSGERFRAVFTNASGSANSNAALLTVTVAAPVAAGLGSPEDVAVDAAGNLYISDNFNDTIVKITPAGVVSTLAGLKGSAGSADGTGSAALFDRPQGIAVDAGGNVYVADSNNFTIRKITPAGAVSTLAGTAGVAGSADGTGSAALFNRPRGVAVDGAGNVYVADTNSATIRVITPAGVVSTLAGLAGIGGSADGKGSAARFILPMGLTVDAAGNVYVADSGDVAPGVSLGNTIRVVTPAGVVSTLAGLSGVFGSADGTGSAASFSSPFDVAVDGAGNVYVCDTGNVTIRKVTPAGVVTTLAGLAGSLGSVDGTGSAARFFSPTGIGIDAAGNVYVAERGMVAIRKVTPAGVVTTFAH